MRILVTGSQGQVARALVQRGAENNVFISTISRPGIEMAQPAVVRNAIAQAIKNVSPTLIVNAAAYTAVDQAEDEPELAHLINAISAGEVAKAAAEASLPIIHLSTDFVFDGTKDTPYTEADQTNPLGLYGISKLAGENAVRAANLHHLILRTAWVYSPFGKNFVKTMLRIAETRSEISVVADQFGNPTAAFDVADGILAAARRIEDDRPAIQWGTYHIAGTGATSWAGFAEEALRLSKHQGGPFATIKHIRSNDYPTKAKRPANSQLNCDAFERAFAWRSANWVTSLSGNMRLILQKSDHGN